MKLRLDPRSAVPPYEQLRVQLTQLIARGSLAPGDRLPTVRQLAADLALAPGTVQRAYRELESAGLVRTQGRHGTTVAAVRGRGSSADRRRALRRAAVEFYDYATSLGAQPPEIDDALEHAVRSKVRPRR